MNLIKSFKIKAAIISSIMGIAAFVTAFSIQFLTLKINFFQNNLYLTLIFISLFSKSLTSTIVKLIFLFLLPIKTRLFKKFSRCLIFFSISYAILDSTWCIINRDLYQAIFTFFIQFSTSFLAGIFVWFANLKKIQIVPLLYSIFLYAIFSFFVNFTSFFKYMTLAAVFFTLVECRVWYIFSKEGNKTFFEKNV